MPAWLDRYRIRRARSRGEELLASAAEYEAGAARIGDESKQWAPAAQEASEAISEFRLILEKLPQDAAAAAGMEQAQAIVDRVSAVAAAKEERRRAKRAADIKDEARRRAQRAYDEAIEWTDAEPLLWHGEALPTRVVRQGLFAPPPRRSAGATPVPWCWLARVSNAQPQWWPPEAWTVMPPSPDDGRDLWCAFASSFGYWLGVAADRSQDGLRGQLQAVQAVLDNGEAPEVEWLPRLTIVYGARWDELVSDPAWQLHRHVGLIETLLPFGLIHVSRTYSIEYLTELRRQADEDGVDLYSDEVVRYSLRDPGNLMPHGKRAHGSYGSRTGG